MQWDASSFISDIVVSHHPVSPDITNHSDSVIIPLFTQIYLGSPLLTELLQVKTHSVSSPWIHEDNVVHIDILITYQQKFPPTGSSTMSAQF
jgi:hypothetical protein